MRLSIPCKFFPVIFTTILLHSFINAQVTFQSASPFPFGAGVNISLLKNNATYRSVVTREYNSVTAENAMKMDAIHPGQNTYNWVDADTLVNYAQQNGKRVHGHTLIWHSQVPAWVSNFVGDSAAWENLMKTHIQTVVTHFKGKVASWDVVNEAYKDDGAMRNTGTDGSIWRQRLGPNYIARAFQYAHEADPSAILFYNDYGHDYSNIKLSNIYGLVITLKNAGIPIHGVGMQMHLDKNSFYPYLANAINVLTQTGLKVHLSELDVSVNPENNQGATFTAALSQLQTHTYKFLTRYYRTRVPPAQQFGITTWNVGDADTWIRPVFNRPDWPLPFDDNYQKKLAYQGIIDGLIGNFDFTTASVQSFAATYNDLGTNGTAITTTFDGNQMTDNDNSSVQNIGFNFLYNGTMYSNFVLTTWGFIKFGMNKPGPGTIYYSTQNATDQSAITARDIDMLYPFNQYLRSNGLAEYRIYTTGLPGSRVCTIQFKNLKDGAGTTQYATMNFQIKLFEAGNIIEFVYGTWTAGPNPATSSTAAVGIKGTYDSTINLMKTATTPWSTPLGAGNSINIIYGNYPGTTAFNTMKTVLPDAGRTFRFTPGQTILPLSLLQLSAAQRGSSINVDWITTNEVNAKSFEVQRSTNGVDFSYLGTVLAKGNASSSQNYYTYVDGDISGLPPAVFYRILQKDKDGRSTHSNVVAIRPEIKNSFVVNVVNPVKNAIAVSIQTSSPEDVTLYIISMNGAIIYQKDIKVSAGSSVISLKQAHLSKGVYLLKVVTRDEQKVVRLIKE